MMLRRHLLALLAAAALPAAEKPSAQQAAPQRCRVTAWMGEPPLEASALKASVEGQDAKVVGLRAPGSPLLLHIVLDLTADVRTYTLAVTVVGSGSVGRTPDLADYQHGSTVTLQAVPAPGGSFTGWSGDTTGSANPVTLTMYANRSVTATFAAPTGVGDGPIAALSLDPARPSPMRGTGQIGFVLPREARVRLSVLDLQGREIVVLAEGAFPAGRHTATWDGRTGRGAAPAGLYFVRLLAEGRTLSQRLVRLR